MKLSPEELVKICMEKHQMVMQLQAELEAKSAELEGLKAEMEAKQQEATPESGEPEMPEEDKEKKMMSENKLSETQSLLLNELNAQVIALSERTKSLEEEKNKLNKELHASNRKNAVDSLLNTGKISPAEVELAEKAYNFKDQDASFWNMFSERRANTAVPLQVNGTSASASEMTLAEHVRTVAKEKSLTFSEALSYVKINNPETYKKHYGV
jgi:capsule polysaccharide export protein KpsE/RkpR